MLWYNMLFQTGTVNKLSRALITLKIATIVTMSLEVYFQATGLCETWNHSETRQFSPIRNFAHFNRPLWQKWHTWGRWLLWVLIWTINVDEPLNPFWQILHVWLFSCVWVRKCLVNSFDWQNAFSHIEQTYGFSWERFHVWFKLNSGSYSNIDCDR